MSNKSKELTLEDLKLVRGGVESLAASGGKESKSEGKSSKYECKKA